ncbi:MAG: hypothetical protein ABIY46_15500, partial [Gemmatimonadales bacterium]
MNRTPSAARMLVLLALAGGGVADTAIASPVQAHRQGADSVIVRVTFSATSGTVNPLGLFTSGPIPGAVKVVAKERTSGAADTVAVAVVPPRAGVAAPAAPAIAGGIPFGSFGSWDGPIRKSNTDDLTLSVGSVDPEELVRRIAGLRATHHRLLLTMTGGAHAKYQSNGVFDIGKWKARMDEFNTPAIQTAVAAAVADGTIIGTSVMDEPQNRSPGKGWGPPGTMTKARVDELCAYVKTMFPTLPAGVVHDHNAFEPAKSYKTCDFIVTQYRWSKTKGDAAAFRDEALALGRRDGIAIAFSLNILDGGLPKRRAAECPVPETGGPGTAGPACRMTPAQVRDWALVLGPAGCALTMWRYDRDFMSNPDN